MIQLIKENFHDFISNTDELLLVEFYKNTCPHCSKLQNELTELEKDGNHKIQLGRVNVQEEYELSDRYNINALPTLLYMIRGEVKERLEGYCPSLVIAANMHKLFHLIS
jgi:thioredoxin 1